MSHLRTVALLILSVVLMSACSSKKTADTIVYNAKIYTLDGKNTIAQAVAVKDGKFLAVGSDKDIDAAYEAKSRINADGKSVFPGFTENYGSLVELGRNQSRIDLSETYSEEDVIKKIKAFAEKNPDKEWIVGYGWNHTKWINKVMPVKHALDIEVPRKAVVLLHANHKMAVVNTKALINSGINSKTLKDRARISYRQGWLYGEEIISELEKAMPQPSEAQLKDYLLKAQEICIHNGITTATESKTTPRLIELIQKMQKEGELNISVNAMFRPTSENLDYMLKNGPLKSEALNAQTAAYLADGQYSSGMAYLGEGTLDHEKARELHITQGKFLLDKSDAEEWKKLSEKGFRVSVKCSGDEALKQTLAMIREAAPGKDARWMLQELPLVSTEDMTAFKELGLIPVVHPAHLSDNWQLIEQGLSPEGISKSYNYKSLLASAGQIAFSTDFPSAKANPLHAYQTALARIDEGYMPADGFRPEEAVNRIDGLHAVTKNAAYAAMLEKDRGTIEVGKRADFIIMDTDLPETDIFLISNANVRRTFINGKSLYASEI